MILAPILFFIAILTNFGSTPYEAKWFLFGTFSAYIVSMGFVKDKFGSIAAMTLFYLICNGLWFWVWRENRYLPVQIYDQMAIRYFASDSVAKLLLICLPIMIIAKDRKLFMEYGSLIASIACLLSSLIVITQFLTRGDFCAKWNSCGGILVNPSMNACMIACLIPLVFRQFVAPYNFIVFGLSTAAIFISKSSIGIGMLAVFIAISLFTSLSGWKKILLSVLSPLPLVVGYLFLGKELLNSSDRWLMWNFFMGKWAFPTNILFGTGFGTFGVFSENLQIYNQVRDKWWIWMHNDWLQCLFELGVVGLLLFVALYSTALIKLFFSREKWLWISLVMFGIFMSMNFPLHLAPSALFGAWLLVCALMIGKEEYTQK